MRRPPISLVLLSKVFLCKLASLGEEVVLVSTMPRKVFIANALPGDVGYGHLAVNRAPIYIVQFGVSLKDFAPEF